MMKSSLCGQDDYTHNRRRGDLTTRGFLYRLTSCRGQCLGEAG